MVPSPKFQVHAVTVPLVVLVNATLNGATPLEGLAVKLTVDVAEPVVAAATLIAVTNALLALPPGPVAVSVTR